MNAPRRQHTVPRFLLERFARRDRITMVSRADLTRRHEVSVRDATVHKDFYTLEGDGLPADYAVEHHLSEIEGKAASAIREVSSVGGFPPSDRCRVHLVHFLAWQLVRGEAQRASTPALVQHLADEIVRRNFPDAKPSEYPRVQVSKIWSLAQLPALVQQILPSLLARPWHLLKFQQPALITGDMPVSLWQSTETPDRGVSPIFADELRFPLDPQTALVLGTGEDETEIQGNLRAATAINTCLGTYCRRWLLHRPTHQPLQGLSLPPAPRTSALVNSQPGASYVMPGGTPVAAREGRAPSEPSSSLLTSYGLGIQPSEVLKYGPLVE